MNSSELLQQMQSGEITTTSKLKVRDESIQKKNYVARLAKLKKENKKKAKLLFIKEIAIPFNPFTGKKDDQYNDLTKFRLTKSCTSTICALKEFLNKPENEEVKKIYMQKAGVSEWDTSDFTHANADDAIIFRKYTVPRLFTAMVSKVNIPSFTGNPFGKQYLMNVKRDPLTGEVQGEQHILLQLSRFIDSLLYEEKAEYQKAIDDGKITKTEEDQRSDRQKINEKRVITGVYPANFGICYEIKLSNKFDIADSSEVAAKEPKEVLEQMRLVNITNEIENLLDRYKSGEFEKHDKYIDFWECDMVCPQNSANQGKLGMDTRYNMATEKISEADGFEPLNNSIINFIDETDNIEDIFMNSAYLSKFDDSLQPKLFECLSRIFPADYKYLTSKVIKTNVDMVTLLYGAKADELLAKADIGLVEEGNLDEVAAAEEGKALDLSAQLSGNADESDELEIEDDF